MGAWQHLLYRHGQRHVATAADPSKRGPGDALYAIAFLGSTPIGRAGGLHQHDRPGPASPSSDCRRVATLGASTLLALRYRQPARCRLRDTTRRRECWGAVVPTDAEPGEVVDFPRRGLRPGVPALGLRGLPRPGLGLLGARAPARLHDVDGRRRPSGLRARGKKKRLEARPTGYPSAPGACREHLTPSAPPRRSWPSIPKMSWPIHRLLMHLGPDILLQTPRPAVFGVSFSASGEVSGTRDLHDLYLRPDARQVLTDEGVLVLPPGPLRVDDHGLFAGRSAGARCRALDRGSSLEARAWSSANLSSRC